MADGDFIHFEANFDELDAATARMVEALEAELAEVVAIGDAVKEKAIRTQLEQIGGPTADPAAISQASAEIARQNELRKEAIELDTADLDILREQVQARIDAAAVQARLQAESAEIIVPAGTRRYSAAGPIAGEQVAAEEAALLAQQDEAAAMLARQRAASQIVIPPVYTKGPTAGQQVAAEEAEAQRAALAAQVDLENQAAAAEQRRIANAARLLEEQQAEVEAQRAALALAKEQSNQAAYQAGVLAAQQKRVVSPTERATIMGPGPGIEVEQWSAADAQLNRYNLALGQLSVYDRDAALSTDGLAASTLRLGALQAEADNSLRAHGALTTEYLTALARGETTINEFGYQLGATIGKFGGWAAAAAATYGALGAVVEFGKGAIDAASSVQQLTRTIPNLDRTRASTALQGVATSTNVPISEAGDAMFQFSRTFHDVDEAATAATLALSTYKLDGVALTDSVKAMTAVHQQFGLSASQLIPIYDELAQGQQKFNARVSDQVPALLKDASAVKLAGGNLRDLIVLQTVAQRTTNLPGSQVGTAFSRSAANFLSPTTKQGQLDRETVSALGINVNQGYTSILFDAIKRAATLTPDQVQELSHAIFGSLRGSLMAGLFTGGATLLPQAQSQLSPAASKGVLKDELAKELATPSQEMKAFLNDIQAMGAALANTGAFAGLSTGLGVILTAINATRGLIDTFDALPSTVKEVITTLVGLRAAMMFVSRTRIGGSIWGIRRVPGFRPSEETLARQQLAEANRPIISALEKNAGKTGAQIGENNAQILRLQVERDAVEAQLAAGTGDEVGLQERRAELSARLSALNAQQLVLENSLVDQNKAIVEAKARQVSYQTSNRSKRISGDDAKAQAAAMNAGSNAEAEDTKQMGLLAYAKQQMSGQVAKATAAAKTLTTATRSETVEVGTQAAAEGDLAAAERIATTKLVEADMASEELTAATVTFSDALATTMASVTAIGESVLGMVMAIDPMTAMLIGLPLVFEALDNSGNNTTTALKNAAATANKPVTSWSQVPGLISALDKLVAAQDPLRYTDKTTRESAAERFDATGGRTYTAPRNQAARVRYITGLSIAERYGPESWRGQYSQRPAGQAVAGPSAQAVEVATGNVPLTAADLFYRRQNTTQERNTVSQIKGFFDPAQAALQADAKNAADTLAGERGYYAQLKATGDALREFAIEHPGKDTAALYAAASAVLAQDREAFAKARGLLPVTKQDPFSQWTMEGPSGQGGIEQSIQVYDDYAKVFGTKSKQGRDALKSAAYAYTFLASQFGGSTDDAALQAIATAETNYVDAANKNASDLMDASKAAPSFAAQTADIEGAISSIEQAIANEVAATNAYIAAHKGQTADIERAVASRNQVDNQLAATLSTDVEGLTAAFDAHTALQAAEVQGISPLADLQRAQIAARGSAEDYQKLLHTPHANQTDLVNARTKALTDANTAAKDLADYNASVIDAQGQLSVAAVTGITPAADLQRAQLAVVAARNKLAQAQSSGAGLAATLADQAALDSAIYSLNQQVQSNAQQTQSDAQGLISSGLALEQSQTLDPVLQATEAVTAAANFLKTIKPSAYKTTAGYLAAKQNAEADLNNKRLAVTAAMISQDTATAQYELDTQQISSQQYIDSLTRLLAIKKMTLSQRQQLEEDIFNANQAGAVNLNVGNIKLPTSYEVRRALEKAHHGESSAQGGVVATVTNHNVWNFNIHRTADSGKVVQAIGKAAQVNTKSAMKAAGVF